MTKTTGKKIKITQPRTKPAAAPAAEKRAEAPVPRPAAPAKRRATKTAATGEPRMPEVGTTLKKTDRAGRVRCECTIEKDGVKYDGKLYASLSGAALAAAKDLGLSGNSFNGFVFWGISKPNRASADPVLRLEQIWKRYSEVVSAVSGERRAEVLKLARGHATQMEKLLG